MREPHVSVSQISQKAGLDSLRLDCKRLHGKRLDSHAVYSEILPLSVIVLLIHAAPCMIYAPSHGDLQDSERT